MDISFVVIFGGEQVGSKIKFHKNISFSSPNTPPVTTIIHHVDHMVFKNIAEAVLDGSEGKVLKKK